MKRGSVLCLSGLAVCGYGAADCSIATAVVGCALVFVAGVFVTLGAAKIRLL